MITRLYTLILVLVVCIGSVQAQMDRYEQCRDQAQELYDQQKYAASSSMYHKAFSQIEGKAYPEDRYAAARAYAQAHKADSAFYHLFRLARDSKFREYEQLTADEALRFLHKNKQWKELTRLVADNKEEFERYLDKPLMTRLEKIHELDQAGRSELDATEEQYGRHSPEMQALWQRIHDQDSLNQIEITQLLDTRGWLGPKVVGEEGSSAIFLVIQHADLAIQQKYLPLMREAVARGDAQGSQLALLEDRVALREGKKQVYGSQIGINDETGEYYVLPLEDPDKVDERRAAVGLPPIQEYISIWNLTWNLEEYKKKMAEMDANKE